MELRTSQTKLWILLLLAAFTNATAQLRRTNRAIPTETLLRIIRAEDERRWDGDVAFLLADKNAKVRERAALAAGRIGDERAVPVLVDLLRGQDKPEVRQMAAFGLGEIESPMGAKVLITLLEDTREPAVVRARAVEALGKIGEAMIRNPPDASTQKQPWAEGAGVPEIRKTIVDALKFEVNRRAVSDRLTILLGLTAVLRTKPDDAGSITPRFLSYSDPRIVAYALNVMARLRLKDANDRVRQLLNHSDPIVRANAARVLGATEDKGAIDELLDRALHDRDLRVRVSAIRALGSLKDVRAAEPLVNRGILLSRAIGGGSILASPDDVGVEECDRFIVHYATCVSTNVPAPARAQYENAIEQWRLSWKKLADNPQTKGTLASVCRQTVAQDQRTLTTYGCGTVVLNEILEIATALGRLLPNTFTARAVNLLSALHILTKGEAVEVEVAFARVVPGIYQHEPYKSETLRGNVTWRQLSRRAQALAAIKDVIIGAATGSAGDNALKDAQSEMRKLLQRATSHTLAIPDILQAYAPTLEAEKASEVLRQYVNSNDVIVRATAAELIGKQPSSEMNTRALIDALPRALRDRDLNDTALAILDGLAKQKNKAANDAIKTALVSSDHIIRRKAVALLKANGVGDFSDRIGFAKTRITEADYRRAIARIGERFVGTKERFYVSHVTATVVTSKGSFAIEFLPEDAPLTVDNFIQLAKRGFFNGQTIPRVVPNFVIQAGDPRGDQNGGPGYQIRCEINEVPYERGAVGMALSGKDTGGSQWFVTHSPQPHLDGGYTVFGRVIRGMDVVDNIARGDVIRRVIVNER